MLLAIYVIPQGAHRLAHVRLAVARLRPLAQHLLVVASSAETAEVEEALADAPPDRILPFPKGPESVLAGYRAGLAALWQTGTVQAPVILASAQAFGPTGDFTEHLVAMDAGGVDMIAPYWHATALEPRLARRKVPDRIGYLDFAILAPGLVNDPGFRQVWDNLAAHGDPWAEFLAGPKALAVWMESTGRRCDFALGPDVLETSDPRLLEIHKLVAYRSFALPVEALSLSPVDHDLGATFLRDALDGLRAADPELYAGVIDFACKRLKLREFNTSADQYEVVPETAADPDKHAWSFGRVAVFIHAFYAEMMPEFWLLVERLPCATHLFLTTASDRDRAEIEDFLREKGVSERDFTVRVVEQNRGRDMSSLFITWRDVVLDGGYEVALRLHSKRTPQVNRQVGESFKAHLFDNLVASSGYVANLLDRLEAEPDIGLVIPPVVHIGFGTLGHSWFNNRSAVVELMREMGFGEVPLDDDTPVAPYGTMYWFRTAALRPMFERRWCWDDYNPEPHHIDGGLAHVQERLIGYVAQARGFRVYSVMTPRLAGRYYAKLEYKAQRVAASLVSGNIRLQLQQTEAHRSRLRARIFRGLQMVYGHLLIRFPALRGPLRPLKKFAVLVFRSGRMR